MNRIVGARGKITAHQGTPTAASRRLATLAPLTAGDFNILNGLKGRTVSAGAVVYGGDGGRDTPCYILSGWSARQSMGPADERQIITVLLPGDSFGIGAAPWAGETLPVCTLTDSVLLEAAAIRTLVRLRPPEHARLVEACQRASWLEQRYALNHMVRLGRQNAYERIAHFVRELFERLDQVGLADGDRFCLPVKQQILADALGLSCVHFNRTARQMKQDRLIDFPRGGIHILDPVKLRDMTDAARIS